MSLAPIHSYKWLLQCPVPTLKLCTMNSSPTYIFMCFMHKTYLFNLECMHICFIFINVKHIYKRFMFGIFLDWFKCFEILWEMVWNFPRFLKRLTQNFWTASPLLSIANNTVTTLPKTWSGNLGWRGCRQSSKLHWCIGVVCLFVLSNVLGVDILVEYTWFFGSGCRFC